MEYKLLLKQSRYYSFDYFQQYSMIRFGSGTPNVCVICDYDALPKIGHACGHNLIAEAGVAAGIGVKAYLESTGTTAGTLTVIGTPAEETGGGKA